MAGDEVFPVKGGEPGVGLERLLKWREGKSAGGRNHGYGKVGAAEGSGPAVGGVPLHYLSLVLGRKAAGGAVKDGESADPGKFGAGDGGRGLVAGPGAASVQELERFIW